MQHLSSFTEERIQRGQQVRGLRTQLEDMTMALPICVSAQLHTTTSLVDKGSGCSLTAWSKVLCRGGRGPQAWAERVAEELSPKLQERRKEKAGAYG